jgi:hypothetical protein
MDSYLWNKLAPTRHPERLLHKWGAHSVYLAESAPADYVRTSKRLKVNEHGLTLLDWETNLCRKMVGGEVPLPIKSGGKSILLISEAAVSVRQKQPIKHLKIDLNTNTVWYNLNATKRKVPAVDTKIESARINVLASTRLERMRDLADFEHRVVNMKLGEWVRRFDVKLETLEKKVDGNKIAMVKRLTDLARTTNRLSVKVDSIGPTTRSLQKQIDDIMMCGRKDVIELSSDGESVDWNGFA